MLPSKPHGPYKGTQAASAWKVRRTDVAELTRYERELRRKVDASVL
jgi:hypothetical protein